MDSQKNSASGETLRAKIQDGSLYEGDGLQAQIRIIDIAVATAKELQRAHSKGIVHCDVNPDNICFDEDGMARVADAELSRQFTGIGEDAADTVSAAAKKDAESAPESSSAEQEKAPSPKETPLDGESALDGAPPLEEKPLLDENPPLEEEPPQEEPAVKPWMDIHAWALTLLEMYLGEKRWTNGDDAKAHLKEYRAACRLSPPPEMWNLIENCLKWKINDFLIVIKDLEKMPVAVMRAAEAAEAAATQQEGEGPADGEPEEQAVDPDGNPSHSAAPDTDPEQLLTEEKTSSQSVDQPLKNGNNRKKQRLFGRIKGLFRGRK